MKVAFTEARRNASSVKGPRAAIQPLAVAYRCALAWLDSRAGAIAEFTDDAIGRCFARILLRFWNFVKSINHPDQGIESECKDTDFKS